MAFLIFTMYDTIFFHSSVGGHLGCFQMFRYCEYYSEHGSCRFEILISVLLGIYSSGISVSCDSYVSNFLRNLHAGFHSTSLQCH